MTIPQMIRGLAVALAIPLASLSAVAQQQPTAPETQFGPRLQKPVQPGAAPGAPRPAPEVISKHGDWTVQCETVPAQGDANGGAAGEKSCGMVQTARDTQRPNITLTLILVSTEQNGKRVTMMRVMAPIGVFLPTGVALEIDGAAVGRVPFTRCLPQLCMAFAEARDETLDKMKKGAKANFIIYEAPGVGITLPISLNGFTAALNAVYKL